ncbi:hypothetical protein [Rhodopirellula bahusiensis]
MEKTAPVKCPCGFGFRIRREAVGNRVICPNCEKGHDIPAEWIRRFDPSPGQPVDPSTASVVPQPMAPAPKPAVAQAELATSVASTPATPEAFNAYQSAIPMNGESRVRPTTVARDGKSRFWALETCALILKCSAVLIVALWLISSIGVFLFGLANGGSDVIATLIPLGVTTVSVLLFGVLLWAVAEVIAVLLAIEENTRNGRR